MDIVLTDRQIRILAYLSSQKKWVNSTKLAEYLETSKKTVQQEIKSIILTLKDKCEILTNNRTGYYLNKLSPDIQEMVIRTFDKYGDTFGVSNRSKEIRVLLLFEGDYISMGKIADRLYLSKTVIYTEIEKIKRWSSRILGLQLELSNSKGIRIIGAESEKRIALSKTMTYYTISKIVVYENYLLKYLEYHNRVKLFLGETLVKYNVILSGEYFLEVVQYIACSVFRSGMGFYLENIEEDTPLDTIIYEIKEKVLDELGYELEKSECIALQGFISEGRMLVISDKVQKADIIFLKLFMDVLEEELQLPLRSYIEDNPSFIRHLELLKYRINNGHNYISYHTNEITCSYPLETHLIKTYFQNVFPGIIPRAEVEYLVMYLAGAMENIRNRYTVLLISDFDNGAIFQIQKKFENFFGNSLSEITAIPTYLFDIRQTEYEKYDFIITTEKELVFEHNNFILINMILDYENLKEISDLFYQGISEKKKIRRKQTYDALLKKYPLTEVTDCMEQLEDFLLHNSLDLSGTVSYNTIYENILYIGNIDSDLQNSEIRRFSLKMPLQFHGKRITYILVARFNGEDCGILDFFDTVSVVLHKEKIQ